MIAADYRARLKIPVEGGPKKRFFTKAGTHIATGYERVVIGNRGPYVEFTADQLWRMRMRVPAKEFYRFFDPLAYYAEFRTSDDADVKVYMQRKLVDYADYKVGFWYVSPFDLVDETGQVLIDKIARRESHDLAWLTG